MNEQAIEAIRQDTEDWLTKAVIGLNLCPFAKSVHVNARLRYVVSDVDTPEALLRLLAKELLFLKRADPEEVETTLIVHPQVLQDFLDFNDFLGAADALVEDLELDGEFQIASFHPAYQFDGTAADDISNYSNRSPYPTLHLLRESSVERAMETMPDTDAIYENNLATLERLGLSGWLALGLRP